MDKQAFRELLQRYLDGRCTERERALVDYWFELWQEDRPQSVLSEDEWQHIADRMWENISLQTTPHTQTSTPTVVIPMKPRRLWMRAAAAVIALLVAAITGWYFVWQTPQESFRVVNTSGKAKQVQLPDGSKVILYNGARLQFPDVFTGNHREVTLEGDAFFDVVHQPSKPFYVKTNHLIIKVLGTSFFVRKTARRNTEVAVRSGRVTVSERYSSNKKNNGVLLTPNQKAIYHIEQGHFVTALVEKPVPVIDPAKAPDFAYNESSLKDVINDLQTVYQIRIVLENEALANCNLTGNLNQMDMYAQLDAITQAIGASYQIKGTVILISGKGCD